MQAEYIQDAMKLEQNSRCAMGIVLGCRTRHEELIIVQERTCSPERVMNAAVCAWFDNLFGCPLM